MRTRYLLLLLFSVPIGKLPGQQFLNGGFERNDRSCGINLSNNEFNVRVPDVTAYGFQSETDLLRADCGYGAAREGNYFIALYLKNGSDEVALKLSEPLKAGSSYTVRFFDRKGEFKFSNTAKVQLGISTTRQDFGELIYTAPAAGDLWQEREFRFRAPVAAAYITVRIDGPEEAWIFLDGFAVVCPELDLGNDTTYCKVANLPLRVAGEFESYRWSTGDRSDRIVVDSPGAYSVEVDDGGACRLRDTIRIYEVERNCACDVYIPNVFSPDGDGVNDTFLPLSPCELLDYELLLFDRWGQLVFRTTDPAQGWDGRFRQQEAPAGEYVYAVTVRFEYQGRPQAITGTITLLR